MVYLPLEGDLKAVPPPGWGDISKVYLSPGMDVETNLSPTWGEALKTVYLSPRAEA